MRKVILDLAVSLDGFIEGPNGEYDWCIMEEDMHFDAFLNSIDTIFFGRKSYELWGNYKPGPETPMLEKDIWEVTNSKKKYVFSRTLKSVEKPDVLISGNIKEEVLKLKAEEGKDIMLFGGASVLTTFINLGLVDQYVLAVHPIILGAGKPLFQNISGRVKLKYKETKDSSSGVVFLTYESEPQDLNQGFQP